MVEGLDAEEYEALVTGAETYRAALVVRLGGEAGLRTGEITCVTRDTSVRRKATRISPPSRFHRTTRKPKRATIRDGGRTTGPQRDRPRNGDSGVTGSRAAAVRRERRPPRVGAIRRRVAPPRPDDRERDRRARGRADRRPRRPRRDPARISDGPSRDDSSSTAASTPTRFARPAAGRRWRRSTVTSGRSTGTQSPRRSPAIGPGPRTDRRQNLRPPPLAGSRRSPTETTGRRPSRRFPAA